MSDFFRSPPPYDEEEEWWEPGYFDRSATPRAERGYQDYIREAMRYNISQTKAASVVPESQFTDYESAISTLESRYAQGYTEHVQRRQRQTTEARARARETGMPEPAVQRIGYAPHSPGQWSDFPGPLRERRLTDEPVQRDEYGGAIVPEGHIHRKNESAFSFSIGALKSSWLGQTAGGFISTFEKSKLMKRIQMTGAHERYQLTNRPSEASPLRYGSTSTGHEMLTPLRSAFVIGGDPGPPGQHYIDPRVGRVSKMRSMDVRGEGLGKPAPVNALFPAGMPVRVASNVAGFTSRRWDYRVADYVDLPAEGRPGTRDYKEAGYRYLMQKTAPIGAVPTVLKEAASKSLGSPRDLSGVTTVGGEALNLDVLASLKDVQGGLQALFQGELRRGPGHRLKMAMQYGFKDFTAMKSQSFSELAPEVLRKYASKSGLLQQIHVPEVVTKHSMPKYAATTVEGSVQPWVNPETGRVDPDRFQTTQRYEALVGTAMLGVGMDADVRQVTLGLEDVKDFKRARPHDKELIQALDRESAQVRRAYGDVIQADAASTTGGTREIPGGTVSAGDPGFRAAVTEALSGAQTAAQKELGVGSLEAVDDKLVSRKFAELMGAGEYGDKFINWGKRAVTMPFRSAAYFSAEGLMKGQEVSKLHTGLYGLGQSIINRDKPQFFESRARTLEQQKVIAESKKARRRAMGWTPGRERAQGFAGMGSSGLMPTEAWVPGVDPGSTLQMFRFPTSGKESFDPSMQVMQAKEETIKGLGLDPRRMHMSEELADALSGDFDADLYYGLVTGKATYKGGKFFDPKGRELSDEAVIKMGQKRQAQGAGPAWKEHVGQKDRETPLTEFIPDKEALAGAQQYLTDSIDMALDPKNVMSTGDIEKETGKFKELMDQIGPQYQNYRRWISQTAGDEQALAGVRDLFNISHGRAQRPKRVGKELEDIRTLMRPGKRGGLYNWATKEGQKMGVFKGITGLQAHSATAFGQLIDVGYSTPEKVGAMMADPGKTRGRLTKAFGEYQGHGNVSKLHAAVFGAQSEEEFLFGGSWGRSMGASLEKSAVKRAKEDAVSLNFAREAVGLTQGRGERLSAIGGDIDAALELVKKGGSTEDFLQAIERTGEKVPFDIPKDAATLLQQEQEAALRAATAAATAGTPVPGGHWASAMGATMPAAQRPGLATAAPGDGGASATRKDPGLRGRTIFPGAVADDVMARVSQRQEIASRRGALSIPSSMTSAAAAMRSTMKPASTGGSRGTSPPGEPPDDGYIPPMMPGMDDPGQPQRPQKGQQQDPGFGFGGGWGRGGGSTPWVSNAQMANFRKIADELGVWGEKVADAIEGTEEFNKEQKALNKEFKGFRSSIEKGQKAAEQMGMAIEQFPDASDEWKRRMRERKAEAEDVMTATSRTPGFARMQGASQLMEERERAATLAGAAGGGDRPPRGLMGRVRGIGMPQIGELAHRFTSGWEIMRLNRLWGLTGGPVFNEMIPAAAQADTAGWQASMDIGGYAQGLPGGVAGGVMQYEASKRQAQIQAGRLGYSAWGWTQQGTAGFQQAKALLGPALGYGAIAGSVATTGAVSLGLSSGGMMATAGTVGLPVMAGVAGVAGTLSTISNQRNMVDPSGMAALQLYQAYQGDRDLGDRWRIGSAKMGAFWNQLFGGGAPVNAQMREAYAAGEKIGTAPLGQLGAQDRATALSYISQELRNQQGTIWSGMSEEQIAPVLAQAAPYGGFENLTDAQIIAQSGGEVAQQTAALGQGPEMYRGLADQFRMGSSFRERLFSRLGNMPSSERQRYEAALGQYAPMMAYGHGSWDIASKVFSGELQRLEGREAYSLEQAQNIAQDYYQATGIDMVDPTARMLGRGATPSAASQVLQSVRGRGSIAAGFGMMGGPSAALFESPIRGLLSRQGGRPGINLDEYQQLGTMAQFAGSRLGYSMAAGGWGGGEALNQFRDTMGMGLVEGAQSLYDIGTGEPGGGVAGGIYNRGALEGRRMAWSNLYATQAYRRTGMQNQLGRLQGNLSHFYRMSGLQDQAAAAQNEASNAGIYRAMESAGLQYRQGMESLGLSRRMWGVQAGFQREQFGVQWGRMMQSREWGREDMAFNRQMSGLEFGWQQEDLDRGIRFATGRQKEALIRQRERGEERFSIQEGRRGTQEERQETLWQQEEQQFAARRQHFEEIKALEAEQFEMRKRHMAESFAMQMGHLAAQLAENQKLQGIQEEMREAEKEKQEDNLKYAISEQEREIAFYEETVFPNQIKRQKLQDDLEDANATYMKQQIADMSAGGSLWIAWERFIQRIKGLLGLPQDFKEQVFDEFGKPVLDEYGNPTYKVSGRAGGGPVTAGEPYKVGESGVETFVPASDGYVFPATQSVGGVSIASDAVNVVINVPAGNWDEQALAGYVGNRLERVINNLARDQANRGQTW